MKIFSKFGLVKTITVSSVLLIFLSLLAVDLVTGQVVSSWISRQAVESQNLSLRIAANILHKNYPEAEITYTASGDVEKIVMAEVPTEFDNHDMIDTVGSVSGETATVFAWDDETADFWRKTTNIIKPDGSRAVGTPLGQKGAVYPIVTDGVTFRGEANILGKDYFTIYQPIFSPSDKVIGILYAGVLSSKIEAVSNDILSTTRYFSVAVLFVAVIALVFLTRNIFAGIPKLAQAAHDMSDGKFDEEVPCQDSKNELGTLAGAMEMLRQGVLNAKHAEEASKEMEAQVQKEREDREALQKATNDEITDTVRQLGDALDRLSQGDLTVKIDQEFPAGLDELRANFNESVAKLRGTMQTIIAGADSIDENSQNMRTSANDLSSRTEQQAASLEETAAALDEITSTVKEASVRANEAAEIASSAKEDTDRSGEVVGEAVSAMEGIEKASSEISNIVSVIDEIAFQTNLLALNAGVEAARAGEAGKGFAVVAQEVRELAQRSATAAKEIQALINRSTSEISNGVDLVKRTGEALVGIAEQVSTINGRISAIATATNEQLTGIQEVNSAVNQMDQMTQQNAAMVQQSNGVTHKMAEDVQHLSSTVRQFQIADDQSDMMRYQQAG